MTWWKLLKNATRSFEKILEVTPHKQNLYGRLPPISQIIQIIRTRHAVHCWRSQDEQISDVLSWTLAYGRVSVDRPARTCIHLLCADTGCRLEDLQSVMGDRKGWRYIYIYIYIERERERDWERERDLCICPTPLYEQDVTQGQFLMGSLIGLYLIFLLLGWLPYQN